MKNTVAATYLLNCADYADECDMSEVGDSLTRIAFRLVESEKHSGVMIALLIPESAAKKIKIQKKDAPEDATVEPVRNMHVTLLYLGKAAEMKDKKEKVMKVCKKLAKSVEPITGKFGGIGRFTASGEDGVDPLYISFDAPGLGALRENIVEQIQGAGIEIDERHGFTPHITIAYVPVVFDEKSSGKKMTNIPDIQIPPDTEFVCDKLWLGWGGERNIFELEG